MFWEWIFLSQTTGLVKFYIVKLWHVVMACLHKGVSSYHHKAKALAEGSEHDTHLVFTCTRDL